MIFKAVLLLTYLLLQSAFKITAFIDPSFKRRLMEKDFSFVVRASRNNVAGRFVLADGNLTCSCEVEGTADFSAIWNGWKDANTLAKRLRLHPMDFMNTGMMTFEGDLSCMDYLLVLLGEMIGSFRKKRPARLERAELGKGPS